jgi:hypothetical protein
MRIRGLMTAFLVIGAFAGCTGGPDNTPTGGSSGTSSGILSSSSSGTASSSSGSSGASSSGGSSGTPLDPSSYATDCSQASDCVAVYMGTDSCCGSCANEVIATKDLSRYEADAAKFRASCTRGVACPNIACDQGPVACTNHRCTLGP